jgi:two-component system, OmpR family, phosphate regulon sensor histidine kinase PhoR
MAAGIAFQGSNGEISMTPQLQREIAVLTSWMFFMLMLGAIFGSIFGFLFSALLVYVIWSLYNLNKLNKWLAKPSKQSPEAIGVWDEVYYQLYNLYKRQRKARRKLTSMLSRFQKSTQALPYATIVLNEFHEISWFNPAAKQLFNLRSRIDIGQRIDNLIRQPEFARYLQKKQYKKPLKFILQKKKVILNITRYSGGQYLISARDITSLSQIDEMRRNFISNASHELRTPLTVISGYVEFLSHKAKDETKIPLERIEEQIIRMNKIISELIELARLESSATIDFSVKVKIDTLMNDVYAEAISLDNNRHQIELDIDTQNLTSIDTLYLYGSYDELRMALSNLLTNAIRYTPQGGDIKLFVSANDAVISVGVQDSGDGIDYEHIPRLTERFYRVDEGRSREVGGTGLGLAIVKHVLDRHSANLYIQSEPGKGSLFRCDFPLSRLEN